MGGINPALFQQTSLGGVLGSELAASWMQGRFGTFCYLSPRGLPQV
jgi:hypothetical protein